MEQIWYVTRRGRDHSVMTMSDRDEMPMAADSMVYMNPDAASQHAEKLAGIRAVLTTIPTWAKFGIEEAEGDDAQNIRECYLKQ